MGANFGASGGLLRGIRLRVNGDFQKNVELNVAVLDFQHHLHMPRARACLVLVISTCEIHDSPHLLAPDKPNSLVRKLASRPLAKHQDNRRRRCCLLGSLHSLPLPSFAFPTTFLSDYDVLSCAWMVVLSLRARSSQRVWTLSIAVHECGLNKIYFYC